MIIKKIFILCLTGILSVCFFGHGDYTYDNVFYETSIDYVNMSTNLDEETINLIKDDMVIIKALVEYGDQELKKIESIRASYKQRMNDNLSGEEITAIRNEMRQALKEYHQKINKEKAATIGVKNYERMSISSYSPYIEYEYKSTNFVKNKDQILGTIANNKYVDCVYVADYKQNIEDDIFVSMLAAGEGYTYDDRLYTGAGVVVGMIETGRADTTFGGLSETDITVYNQRFDFDRVTEHATQMACIIAGKNGVAPDAKILSAQLSYSPNNEVEWLLDNGVDIVNMSYGCNNSKGTYNSESAYMDYIAPIYDVLFVGAAGNDSDESNNYCGPISNPGLGYNVLTVAASTSTNGCICSYSSNTIYGDTPQKPTIAMPGDDIYYPDENNEDNYFFVSGTSPATALVSGVCALLMEKWPAFKSDPERLIAYLVATAVPINRTASAFTPTQPLNKDEGAGYLYSHSIGHHEYDFASYTNMGFVSDTGYVFSHELTVEQGDHIRASICWDARATGKPSETVFGNYDIELYKDGLVVDSSSAYRSVVEILDYVAEESGTYQLYIKQYGGLVYDLDIIYYYIWTGEEITYNNHGGCDLY